MATNGKRLQLDSLIFIFVTIFVILLLLTHPIIKQFILSFGREAGLLGIFIVGFFYTASTTAPVAAVAAFFFGEIYSPWLIAGVGALGAMCADFLLFKFLNHKLQRVADYFARKLKITNKTRNRLGNWAPILAFAFIALPLPDEIGVAILGGTHIKTKRFFIISYFANFTGLLLLSYLGSVL